MARQPPTELKRDKSTDRAFVRWNGKKFYFGKWNSPQARTAFGKWLAEVIQSPTVAAPPSRITVAECVEQYLLHARRYYPDGEFGNVFSALQTLLASDASERAVDFGPKRLKSIQKRLSEELDDDDNLKYARTTINAKVDRIRRCFRWCASEELIPVEVVTALDTVTGLGAGRGLARESTPVSPVSMATVALTLPFVSPTVRAMIEIQFLCGMRPQDVCGMTTGAIDRTGEIWIYRPEHHKGRHRGQSLMKAIPGAAQSILKPLLRDSPNEPLFSPLDSKQHFGNAPKKAIRGPYSTASYGKSIVYGIQRAAKQIPPVTIPHWQPNQLRHAIATEIRRTLGIEAAQAYLGHTKPDTTTLYAEQTERALREIARGIVSPLSQPQPESIQHTPELPPDTRAAET